MVAVKETKKKIHTVIEGKGIKAIVDRYEESGAGTVTVRATTRQASKAREIERYARAVPGFTTDRGKSATDSIYYFKNGLDEAAVGAIASLIG